MNSNSVGKDLVMTCFGESHGSLIGTIIDGCPAGLPISSRDIQVELDKRKPGFSGISSPRIEQDKVEISSGIFRGYTTGGPICLSVRNLDPRSEEYKIIKHKPRPGHADYTSQVRYGGFNDYRGGGRFSGRITVSYVMAGAIAKKLLATIGVKVIAHTIQIGNVAINRKPEYNEIEKNTYQNNVRCAIPETASLMEKEIIKIAGEKDSLGGIVEALALNVPAGIGDPIFDSLDSDIGKIMFNIPGVKGVEFGTGFQSAKMRGSTNNDNFSIFKGKVVTLTNNSGGILGGISNGMPIVVRIAFKPTSSIGKKQKTVDLRSMKETEIEVEGRHDPCIVPRAVVVVEACLAFILADHAVRSGKISKILK